MNLRSKRSCLSSRAPTKRFILLRRFGGPRFIGPGFAWALFTVAVLRTWSFGHLSLRCLSSRSGRIPVPQCGQIACGGRTSFVGWGGCVAARRGPIDALSGFLNLIRLLGRATIAFNSLSNVVPLTLGLAPRLPTTPVPLQRKQLGLAPRQVQSGTPNRVQRCGRDHHREQPVFLRRRLLGFDLDDLALPRGLSVRRAPARVGLPVPALPEGDWRPPLFWRAALARLGWIRRVNSS